jgi:hypothetical protein
MDARKPIARGVFKAAYAHGQYKPRSRREEPFHLGPAFDVMVIVALLIAVVGYLTA